MYCIHIWHYINYVKASKSPQSFRCDKIKKDPKPAKGLKKKNKVPVSIWHKIKLQPFRMPNSQHHISNISHRSKRKRKRGWNKMPGQVKLLRTNSKVWTCLKLKGNVYLHSLWLLTQRIEQLLDKVNIGKCRWCKVTYSPRDSAAQAAAAESQKSE